MSNDKSMADVYKHGNLLNAIQDSLHQLGKTIDNVTIQDLAPVDEFHIGGRQATEHFIEQLSFSKQDHILDVGCGLGGAARFVADTYHTQVTGIDITEEYITTGNALSSWINLDNLITLHQGSALAMPFDDGIFDGGYMLHVGMNIEDKVRLFQEIYRVLRPGASFGIYDVMRKKEGKVAYPVPWADNSRTCSLASSEQYWRALGDAGFEVVKENNRRNFALEFFEQLQKKSESKDALAPLGLHTLMQESTASKVKNMIENIKSDYIFPVEIITKRS